MTAPASKLLQPITVGPLELKNRIMFPPLTTGYEERDGSIGERSLAFYERLARGGVSYIVIGDVAPVMTASPTPKLATDAQIPTFKALADAVHKHGAKVALQLFHPEYDVPGVGRMVMGSMAAAKAAQEAKAAGDEETFAAKMAESNEIRKQAYAKLHHDMQHFVNEASVEQLTQIKEAIAASAARAQQAGIDAIEVHGDRLVGSLCSAILNKRTDEYGGSFENRVRYALEVVAAIKEAAPQLMVEYKLPVIMENPDGTPRGKGGLLPDEACEFAKLLEDAGIDMIQVAQANHTGNMGDTIPPMGAMPYNWTLPVAERVKALVSVPVATVGRVVSVEAGEKILEDGSADIIAYGRSLMCDPDIALKAATGEPIRECLNCNKGCVDAIQNRKYISCVLNAENGDEATIAIKPGDGDKKIAVVGGGIGTAPMYQLTRELAAAGVKPDVFFGFRDAPYCMEEYRSIANLVKVSTDTGAVGFHGFVTQLYDPADYDVVLVCGPTVMMRNAARLCAEKGTPCFVSMEKKMACGIGACLGCTCETKGGEGKSVCKNGPVFDATEVFF